VRGVVGALDHPANAPLRGSDPRLQQGANYARVAWSAGLCGLALGALSAYAIVAWRGSHAPANVAGSTVPPAAVARGGSQ
jgi:hypothetical protein